MRKSIYFIGVLLLSIFLLPLVIHAAPVGNFTYIKGNVDITSSDQEARPATVGMEVYQADIIRTKSKSKAEIIFIDGTILRLAQSTRVEINEYVSNQEQTSVILKLFRGKVQNKVRGLLGRIFGKKERNRFEVRTPTSVCGVRGTDFFAWYVKGQSGAAFREGTGYGYSINRPDEVKTIDTGQAMIVISPDEPPVIKPATDIELEQHLDDTAPTEEGEEEAAEEEVVEEEAAEEEVVEEAATEETTEEPVAEDVIVEEVVTEEPVVTVEELESDMVGTGAVGTDTTGTGTDELSITTGGGVESPEIEIYEDTGELDLTFFSGDFTVGFLTDGSLTGSIDNLTGGGEISITGTFTGSPSGPDTGSISGNMDNGAFAGETGLAIGSLNGTFASFYLYGGTLVEVYPGSLYYLENPGIGYLYGAYSGSVDTVNGVLSAGGSAYRSGTLGAVASIDISPGMDETPADALPGALSSAMTSFGYPIPELGAINAGGNFGEGSFSPSVTAWGIDTASGRTLGLWSSTATGGNYTNDPDSDPATPGLSTWYGVYGETNYSSYYMLGSVRGSDDLAGHLSVDGNLTYLDSTHLGSVYLWNNGVYDVSTRAYESAGTGTFTLDPLIVNGWADGSLMYYDPTSPTSLQTASDAYGMLGATAFAYPQLTLMGDYTTPSVSDPFLMYGSGSYVSGMSLDSTLTDYDAFYGYLVGVTRDGEINGEVRTLAIEAQDGGYIARSLEGNASGYAYSGLDMWAATSVLTPDTQFDNSTTVTPATLSSSITPESFNGYYGAGNFGAGGTLELLTATGDPIRIMDQDWGIWNAGFGGTYSGSASTSWNLTTGGDYYNDLSVLAGLWLGHITGTNWGDPDISGTYGGTALTDVSYYEFTGDILGTRKETGASGDWQAAGIGPYTMQTLSLNGSVDYMMMDGFAYWDTTLTPYPDIVTYPSSFYGNIGAPDSLFTGFDPTTSTYAPIPFAGLGWYCPDTVAMYDPTLLVTDISGGFYNIADGDALFNDGFYDAGMGGSRTGESVDAKLVGLYAIPDGSGTYEAGFIESNMLDITLHSGAHIWEIPLGSDTLTARQMATALPSMPVYTFDPFPLSEPAHIGGDIAGISWVDSASFYVDDIEQPWGIWTADSGGSHSGISAPWEAVMGWTEPEPISYLPGWGEDYNIVHLEGTSLVNGRTSGTASGQFLNLSGNSLGQITGDFFGAYDSSTWETVALGTWEAQTLTASSGFYGNLLQMTPGRSYSGAFEEYNYDPASDTYWYDHYNYEYLKQDGTNTLLYGEKWESDWITYYESGYIYLPTGRAPDDGSQVQIMGYMDLVPDFSYMGTWTVGSLTETSFFNDPGAGWDPIWYQEEDSNVLVMSGTIDGGLGIVGDPVNATSTSPAGLVLMGNYAPIDPVTLDPASYGEPYLFGMEFGQTSDPLLTYMDYQGFIGGVIDDVTGGGYAIYIAGDTAPYSTGVFDLKFSGPTYPEIGMWEATGSIYPVLDKGTIDIAPQDLQTSLVQGALYGWLEGDFGSQDSEIFSYLGWGTTLSILGHEDWGIYELAFGYSNFAENPHDAGSFSARAGGAGQFGEIDLSGSPDSGYWLTAPFNGTLNNGMLTVDSFTGNLLTVSKYADIFGRAAGCYDTNDGSWQAFASGYWDNSQALNFNGVVDGSYGMIRKEYSGYGYDAGGSDFSFGYDAVGNNGWSYYEDGSTITNTNYSPDGTTETWISNYTTGEPISSSTGTWGNPLTDSLLTVLQNIGIGYDLVYYNWEEDSYSDYNPYYFVGRHGSVEGLLGGLSDLWAEAYDGSSPDPGPGAAVTLMGEADSWWEEGLSPLPQLFSAEVFSYNPDDHTETIMHPDTYAQDGAYSGFIGGRTSPGSILLDGRILALSVDATGNTGIVKGSINGEVYEDLEMWEASGSVFPIPLLLSSATGYSGGADLESNLQESFSDPPNNLPFTGVFRDAERTIIGNIYANDMILWDQTIGGLNYSTGEPWGLGVRSYFIGGTYDGAISDTFAIPTHRRIWDDIESTFTDIRISQGASRGNTFTGSTGSWSGGLIDGMSAGSWIRIDDLMGVAFTGVAGGDIKGTFDPTHSTWQASVMMAGMDTNTFLGLLEGTPEEIERGENQLAQLNIPYVELGRADLSGSTVGLPDGDSMDVNMKGVKFFSYSDGSAPALWATSSVSGTYTGTPMGYDSANRWVVPLDGTDISNTSGLHADFVVQSWDQPANTWTANVNNGSGQVNGASISFGGGAAGEIDTGAGTFDGTASGTAGRPAAAP